jgi:hypothetical protein
LSGTTTAGCCGVVVDKCGVVSVMAESVWSRTAASKTGLAEFIATPLVERVETTAYVRWLRSELCEGLDTTRRGRRRCGPPVERISREFDGSCGRPPVSGVSGYCGVG